MITGRPPDSPASQGRGGDVCVIQGPPVHQASPRLITAPSRGPYNPERQQWSEPRTRILCSLRVN